MFQPRNTFVVVKMDEISERKEGAIVVSTNSDQFNTGTVVAIGPGSISADGGRSETFDLHVGDRVLVKHQDVRAQGNALHKVNTGTTYTHDGEKFTIFEQMAIIAITATT
jgi:co-chaperonin GroES (HSP10)